MFDTYCNYSERVVDAAIQALMASDGNIQDAAMRLHRINGIVDSYTGWIPFGDCVFICRAVASNIVASIQGD